jgi:hypothetical protein
MMAQDPGNTDPSADPALSAALSALLDEIEQAPVSPRIRALSRQLQDALAAARLGRDDTTNDTPG